MPTRCPMPTFHLQALSSAWLQLAWCLEYNMEQMYGEG